MTIRVLCVGKIKESFYREAIAEYTKRLGRYASVSIIEVEDEKTPDKASEKESEQIREKEADRIISRMIQGEYIILLDIGGKKYDSITYAKHLESLTISGNSTITFIIGGSLGVSDKIRSLAKERLSFSDFTFPHQLMRVILLEQVYRAFRIMNHEPYHK